jgi:carboxymethylenebutenolidase
MDHEHDRVSSLVHLYEDGAFSRRELISRLTKHTGSAAAAAAVLQAAGLAEAQTIPACPTGVQVSEQDPAVISQLLTIHGEGGPLFIYQSLPADYAREPRPAVLVVHENRGLNEHIKDVNRRVAKAGFVAVAVDLLSRQGGTHMFADPEVAGQAYNRTTVDQRREDMASTLLTIRDQPYVRRDRLGAVGFCAGGGNVFDLAVTTNLLNAAVVFYGAAPAAEAIPNLQAPLLGIFAELDRGINSRLPGLLTALMAGNKRHAIHIYENARHAFHNDTGAGYDPGASCDAWPKTIAFFQRHLNAA